MALRERVNHAALEKPMVDDLAPGNNLHSWTAHVQDYAETTLEHDGIRTEVSDTLILYRPPSL